MVAIQQMIASKALLNESICINNYCILWDFIGEKSEYVNLNIGFAPNMKQAII